MSATGDKVEGVGKEPVEEGVVDDLAAKMESTKVLRLKNNSFFC